MVNDFALSVLTCGGTIAMTEDTRGDRRPADSDEVVAWVCEHWAGEVVHAPVFSIDSAETPP